MLFRSLEAVFDVAAGFVLVQRADVAGGRHTLAELLHLGPLKDFAELGLADQKALQQGLVAKLEVRQHALMQSFLVGQPEFREILQRPEMEQFRQRVAATCHIGPLDLDETQHYIEHRLKCAGSIGKPSFEPAAFEAVFKASGGIPRRINSICDRLLLAGFLANKLHLELADVNEVVREFAQEAEVPRRRAAVATESVDAELSANGAATASAVLDVDLSKLQLDPAAADTMSRQLNRLATEQRGDQLQRVERGLLRLERTNLQLLAMLQQLVSAVKKPTDEGPK